ncbi:MAG TPA: hypothetical protein GXZ70_02860 [Clostridiales bacterium]|nr:hypothetical protein [Clostridiales bacterium]
MTAKVCQISNDDVFRQIIEGVKMLGDEIEFEFCCGTRVRERVLNTGLKNIF